MNIAKRVYCRVFQGGFRIVLPILPFRIPKQLNNIDEIPELLKNKKIDSVLLVVDKKVRELGLVSRLEDGLVKADIDCAVYEQETPNPTIKNVETAKDKYLSAGAKAIIAVGGGSAMDCAKVAGARIVRPNKSVQKMRGIIKIILPTPLFIAVPTTAGTGSEATLAAVITDGEKHHKYPVNDFCLIPDYAVLDPGLTLGLPPFVTATTGMDALTHAIEAYIGHSTSRFTRAMSIEAVQLINTNLEAAVENGNNVEARAGMLRAAFCAGMSFTRSFVGYVHGIAHSLGGKYGTAHGLANAVILPVMLREYGKSCEKRLARLARLGGVVADDVSDADAALQFITRIEELNAKFGIPTKFEELKEADIDEMAEHADKESNPLYPVPKLMDKKELAAVYRKFIV